MCGLTAVLSTKLAAEGISCNIVAGTYIVIILYRLASHPAKIALRGIVAEPHKWCGTDFLDLASLDPLWNTPSWDIKNGILEKFFLHSGGLAQLIF